MNAGDVRDWRKVGSPDLTAKARRYLKERGISTEVTALNNLRSLAADETAALWGKECRVEALLFPFAKSYAVARLLGRKEGKFRAPPGRGSRIYVPMLPARFKHTMDDTYEDTKYELLVCEGPTRVLAAISYGFLAIGISGCWNWQKDRKPLRELREIRWKRRTVIPIFDADINDNPQVLLPYLLLGDWLCDVRRAKVQYLRLPTVAGPHTGLDDYLALEGAKGFSALKRTPWAESLKLEALRVSAIRNTEGGLAALFALRYGDDVRYDAEEECWYAWIKILWERQSAKALRIQEYVKETVAWILHEGIHTGNAKRREKLLKWAIACDRKVVIRGAMDLASSTAALRVSPAELDQDPYLLGTQSGVIDLRSGQLVKAEREQLITRAVGVAFDPTAECPRWEQFIAEVMCSDPEMVAFMQRFCGYLLFGGNPERLIFFLFGVGRNGKSVFLETLLKLLGDYGTAAKSAMLMRHRIDRDSESAQPFMLKLRGMRGITASEVDEGMELDAGTVKDLTGNDEIAVRGLFSAPVRFVVAGKIVVRCNHRPHIDSGDQAVWDRVVEIPFDLRLEEHEQDKTLAATLRDELPGILNWALAGFRQYHKHNDLKLPAKVRRQIESYREDMDTVLKWLSENTVADRTARTPTKVLYTNYEYWCGKRSRPGRPVYAQSRQMFARTLTHKGFRLVKGNRGARTRRGVRLNRSAV